MNVRKIKGFLRVAGPAICACLASVGIVVTAALSAKGALKAEKVLNDEKIPLKEKVKAAAPAFIPAGVAGIATTGLIFVANILGVKQQTALMAGTATIYKSLQERINARYGWNSEDVKPEGPVTFYDPFSMRYFERTINEVLKAEYCLNRNFILRGDASVNEFYRFLGLEETCDGDEYGWSQCVGFDIYGYQWIDFCHDFVQKGKPVWTYSSEQDSDGNPLAERDCYVIDMPFEPTDDYLTYPYEE